MPTARLTPLPDRGVIKITGSDAAPLLDGLLTNSLGRLDEQGALHTAHLSPQGKILFDFFLVATAEAFYADIDHAAAGDFVKRLSLYRLRADVAFEDVSGRYEVAAIWPGQITLPGGLIAYADPRHPHMGMRLILPPERLSEVPAATATPADYHAHRIQLGVPEARADYALGDTFPHEAIYDQLGSVDFKKGCFIGQEVVSRMQHRGTARRRAVRVRGEANLTPGAEVTAGEAKIGHLGSAAGERAIAVIRLDRLSEAKTKGTPVSAGGVAIELDAPDWITFNLDNGRPADA